MDIVGQLEQMKMQGKKVVSIDFMIKELRGIPPTRQQTGKISPRIDFIDDDQLIAYQNEKANTG